MRGTSAGVTACSPFDAVPRSLICSDQAATPIGINHAVNAAYTVHVALLQRRAMQRPEHMPPASCVNIENLARSAPC